MAVPINSNLESLTITVHLPSKRQVLTTLLKAIGRPDAAALIPSTDRSLDVCCMNDVTIGACADEVFAGYHKWGNLKYWRGVAQDVIWSMLDRRREVTTWYVHTLPAVDYAITRVHWFKDVSLSMPLAFACAQPHGSRVDVNAVLPGIIHNIEISGEVDFDNDDDRVEQLAFNDLLERVGGDA